MGSVGGGYVATGCWIGGGDVAGWTGTGIGSGVAGTGATGTGTVCGGTGVGG